jgi:hypothetical protein
MATSSISPATGPIKNNGKRRSLSPRPRGGPSKESARYFIGKSSDPKPVLDQEVMSEPEGLVIAFKTDARLFVVHEFTVEQKIERGRVSLEKAPAATSQRVSTTNAS